MKWIIENKKILSCLRYDVSDATALSDFVWIESKIKTVAYHIDRRTPVEIFLTPVKSLYPSEDLVASLLRLYDLRESFKPGFDFVTGNPPSS